LEGILRLPGRLARFLLSVSHAALCRLCLCRDENAINTVTGKGAKKRGKSGDALNRLLKYLLPLAGKRIVLLLGLAVVRTAFSNRLARMQVRISRVRNVSKSRGDFLQPS
jgi:hypothetical protein